MPEGLFCPVLNGLQRLDLKTSPCVWFMLRALGCLCERSKEGAGITQAGG